MGNDLLFEDEQRSILGICDSLCKASNALAVLAIDKNGQEIVRAGETDHLDVTSLSSLFAGNVAATGGIAKLLAENEFGGQYHEGERTHVHISLVAKRAILVVLFDGRSSLGLVRLRVRKASEELAQVFAQIDERRRGTHGRGAPGVFGEITDDDIDNLFKD